LPLRSNAALQALLEEGCDLEADILPIVAREVPELPRPLKKWSAPWLVRDIADATFLREEERKRIAASAEPIDWVRLNGWMPTNYIVAEILQAAFVSAHLVKLEGAPPSLSPN
jgi:hypothetical protein